MLITIQYKIESTTFVFTFTILKRNSRKLEMLNKQSELKNVKIFA